MCLWRDAYTASGFQGMSPADLAAIINIMKRAALRRMPAGATESPPLQVGDLEESLGRVQPRY